MRALLFIYLRQSLSPDIKLTALIRLASHQALGVWFPPSQELKLCHYAWIHTHLHIFVSSIHAYNVF